MAQKKYAPHIPFTVDDNNNIKSIDAVLENCNQLLKMIVLTNPGEKLMDPAFGVGIRRLLFENQSQMLQSDLEGRLTALVKSQTNTYASDLIIGKISAIIENNTLYLSIPYNYKNYFVNTAIVNIPLQG